MANKPVIGGQAVLEGVMMRSPVTEKMAICVRRTDGTLALSLKDAPVVKDGPASWFLVRGVVNFVRMLVLGMQTLTESAQMLGEEFDEEPSRFEKWVAKTFHVKEDDVVLGFAVVLALLLAVGMFFVLPNLVATFISRWVSHPLLVNLIDGVVRMAVFLIYMLAVSQLKEIKRNFAYHGAEHKVVNCFEADLPMTVENARGMTTRNPRCGTAFLLIVMLISILVFTLTGWNGGPVGRLLIRLALLPVVSGISYEVLMALSRHDNAFVRILRAPGMALQGLTTKEPDDGMLEAALAAFVAVLTPEQRAQFVPEEYRLPTEEEEDEPELEVEFYALDPEEGDEDGEWVGEIADEDCDLEIEWFELPEDEAEPGEDA